MQIYPAVVAGLSINAHTSPPLIAGWYLAVVEGHGTRRWVVDFFDLDDHQWQEERKDSDVSVTFYRKLPHMPVSDLIERIDKVIPGIIPGVVATPEAIAILVELKYLGPNMAHAVVEFLEAKKKELEVEKV